MRALATEADPVAVRHGLKAAAGPLAAAAVVGAATLGLRFRDPHEQGSWGFCPFLLVTGHPCPGCGGLRAVNDLTHFDLVGAASSNLLFVASIPLIVFGWYVWLRKRWAGEPIAGPSSRAVLIAFGVVIAFGVLRNLPFAGWLAP